MLILVVILTKISISGHKIVRQKINAKRHKIVKQYLWSEVLYFHTKWKYPVPSFHGERIHKTNEGLERQDRKKCPLPLLFKEII